MKWPSRAGSTWGLTWLILASVCCARGETFRVATYNLDAYLATDSGKRKSKSEESRQKIREIIRILKPDVMALQEVGGKTALLELQGRLRQDGIELPYTDLVCGADTNIHLAVLSRFPILQTRPQTNASFLLGARRFNVSRGFGEVDIQVCSNYSFTLITAHLKSKRVAMMADESEQRLEEAKLLRARIDARLAADPEANLVVVGDLNDTPESRSTRTVLGSGPRKLVDSCPRLTSEGSGGTSWTYYYAKANEFTRIDYILLSQGMAREWITNNSAAVSSVEGWELASDHRPVIATFFAEDR